MLRHNLLVIYRNSIRNKTTFFINLIGLSTGLACALMIYLWVNSELDVDKFNKNDSRRFQVMENQKNSGSTTTVPATPDLLAESLANEMPEVEYATAVTPSSWFGNFSLSVNDKNVKVVGQFADKNFFRVFPYDLVQGDPTKVLSVNHSVVVSEQLARRLFGSTENAVGKSIEWQLFGLKTQATVSGIFGGVPQNSTERFDFILSYDSWIELNKMIGRSISWDNHGPSSYVLLKKGTDVKKFNDKIAGFIKSKFQYSNVTLFARPYSDGYLYNKYENGVQAGGRIEYVKLFSIIAIFILMIACINFMNLSTARASGRMKEVGIKKAVGAPRRSLVLQYLGESVLIAFISLAVSLVIVELVLPQFNEITGKQLMLSFNTRLILFFLGITLFTGLAAGSYPALYLSGFNPATVLKGKLRSSVGELWARKGLVVFQFALSVILIVAVLIVYRQMGYIQAKNLGYDKDNVIYFDKEGQVAESQDAFLSELRNIPGIVNASNIGQNLIGINSSTYGLNWEGKKPGTLINFVDVNVGYDMIETLGIQMKSGRSFSRSFGADSSAIVFNQAAIDVMGLKDPIGRTVNLWGQNRQIIGVTNDFNFESLHEQVKPLFFILEPKKSMIIMTRIKAGREKETIDRIQKFYETYNPGFSFDYKFLDQDYQALYTSEQRVAALSRYFAGMAIIISCLGLFGLTAFAAERRLKEIGIRKVLGASVSEIIYLLSKELASWVLIANVIAWPVAFYFMNGWLQSFAYRSPMEVSIFLLAGGVAMLTALATVSFHAIKAATANPIESLRYE